MKIAASLVMLLVVGIGLALGANYAGTSGPATASKICACESCCPDGGCCCESGFCSCEKCLCDCCSENANDCGANCCTEKAEALVAALEMPTCSKGCCKK